MFSYFTDKLAVNSYALICHYYDAVQSVLHKCQRSLFGDQPHAI